MLRTPVSVGLKKYNKISETYRSKNRSRLPALSRAVPTSRSLASKSLSAEKYFNPLMLLGSMVGSTGGGETPMPRFLSHSVRDEDRTMTTRQPMRNTVHIYFAWRKF